MLGEIVAVEVVVGEVGSWGNCVGEVVLEKVVLGKVPNIGYMITQISGL